MRRRGRPLQLLRSLGIVWTRQRRTLLRCWREKDALRPYVWGGFPIGLVVSSTAPIRACWACSRLLKGNHRPSLDRRRGPCSLEADGAPSQQLPCNCSLLGSKLTSQAVRATPGCIAPGKLGVASAAWRVVISPSICCETNNSAVGCSRSSRTWRSTKTDAARASAIPRRLVQRGWRC